MSKSHLLLLCLAVFALGFKLEIEEIEDASTQLSARLPAILGQVIMPSKEILTQIGLIRASKLRFLPILTIKDLQPKMGFSKSQILLNLPRQSLVV